MLLFLKGKVGHHMSPCPAVFLLALPRNKACRSRSPGTEKCALRPSVAWQWNFLGQVIFSKPSLKNLQLEAADMHQFNKMTLIQLTILVTSKTRLRSYPLLSPAARRAQYLLSKHSKPLNFNIYFLIFTPRKRGPEKQVYLGLFPFLVAMSAKLLVIGELMKIR